jgi:hypothetical protein
MELRCPHCNADLTRRVAGTVMPRLSFDCPSCRARVEMNVHPVESTVMIASFAGFVAFAALYYFIKDDGFLVGALACLAPAALLPLFERHWFRGWPRYRKPGS